MDPEVKAVKSEKYCLTKGGVRQYFPIYEYGFFKPRKYVILPAFF